MTHRKLIGAVALTAAATLASCGLPPITTSEQSITIPYNGFVPSITYGVPLVTGLPAFQDRQAGPTTIPLPGEARAVKLNSVNLNLKMRNTGPIPLRIKLFLSREGVDPYTTPALGGDQAQIDLDRNMTDGQFVTKTFSIDPALLQEQSIKLGYTFGSPGTSESVTFTADDKVEVRHSVTVQPKLF